MSTDTSWPPASRAIDFAGFQAFLASDPALPSGPGSITWRVNSEIVLALGWGRAVLMQIAHPMIAEGVAHHSTFSHSATAKLKRFHRTLDRMLRLTFGTPYEVWQAAQSIDHIHNRVHGELADHGCYSARQIDLLKWVHATFVDSILRTYSLFVAPLSVDQWNDYLFKASIVGPSLGAPRGYFPETCQALKAYIDDMLSSGTLRVGESACTLADYVLAGVEIPLIGPVSRRGLKLTIAALLPEPLRVAYELQVTALDRVILRNVAFASRQLHRVLPARLHRWPLALKAEIKAKT